MSACCVRRIPIEYRPSVKLSVQETATAKSSSPMPRYGDIPKRDPDTARK